FSSRRRHTRSKRDWSSDVCSSDLLRTFLEVAKLEHLGHAADVLGADQSTVSRKIVRLETEFGVPLFERIGRSIRLTQAGRRLVRSEERRVGKGCRSGWVEWK